MVVAGNVRSSAAVAHASAIRARSAIAIATSNAAMITAFDVLARNRVVCARAGVLVATRRPLALTSLRSSGAFSGRVLRSRQRHQRRLAASTESTPVTPPQLWAHAEVFGLRLINGPSLNPVNHRGLPAEPTACSWTIRELDARDIPGARSPRCLVFENHESVRRLWDYPGTWLTMPAAALLALAGL